RQRAAERRLPARARHAPPRGPRRRDGARRRARVTRRTLALAPHDAVPARDGRRARGLPYRPQDVARPHAARHDVAHGRAGRRAGRVRGSAVLLAALPAPPRGQPHRLQGAGEGLTPADHESDSVRTLVSEALFTVSTGASASGRTRASTYTPESGAQANARSLRPPSRIASRCGVRSMSNDRPYQNWSAMSVDPAHTRMASPVQSRRSTTLSASSNSSSGTSIATGASAEKSASSGAENRPPLP